jgi:pantoate--beta-alanine ligase
MQVIHTINEMVSIAKNIHSQGKTIGFVPTMGFLHKGHTSLFDKSSEQSDVTIASLFVNPTQFGPNEDYNQYPRDLERDKSRAEAHNVEYLFVPDALEMYPIGFGTSLYIKNITDKFEGKLRPGHFDGVALVVAKLLNIIRPEFAFFGQKDYQQTLVIKQIVKDMNIQTKIIVTPIIRLESGLALSSRNTYLSEDDLKKSTILYNAMASAKAAILDGERHRKNINAIMHQVLRSAGGIRIDYASVALADDLSEPELFYPNDAAVLLLAVYIGKTRLIDNILLSFPKISQKNN